jgi:hypothetical protein
MPRENFPILRVFWLIELSRRLSNLGFGLPVFRSINSAQRLENLVSPELAMVARPHSVHIFHGKLQKVRMRRAGVGIRLDS